MIWNTVWPTFCFELGRVHLTFCTNHIWAARHILGWSRVLSCKILGIWNRVVAFLGLLECYTLCWCGQQKHKFRDIPTPSQDTSNHPCITEHDFQLKWEDRGGHHLITVLMLCSIPEYQTSVCHHSYLTFPPPYLKVNPGSFP